MGNACLVPSPGLSNVYFSGLSLMAPGSGGELFGHIGSSRMIFVTFINRRNKYSIGALATAGMASKLGLDPVHPNVARQKQYQVSY